jgi:acetyl esterase/lipase
MGSRKGIPVEELEGYLQAGFAVVSIDYRLAPETKIAGIIEDLEDAYGWIRTQGSDLFGIDPNRIAIVGHSAGGYLTLMAGFRLKPRPKALVSYYGYGNITGDWYAQPDPYYNLGPAISKEQALRAVGDSVISEPRSRDRRQFYLYCRQQGLWPEEVCGHDPEKEYAWYSNYEPLRNVTRVYPPTILLHGRKDTDVPFEQSFLMAEALKHHGIDYEFITNPDWGHGFDRNWWDPEVQKAFSQTLIFLKKHIFKNAGNEILF